MPSGWRAVNQKAVNQKYDESVPYGIGYWVNLVEMVVAA